MNAVNFLEQSLKAAEMELVIIAKMLEMEKKGIVRRDSCDSWTVLDLERYITEMGV